MPVFVAQAVPAGVSWCEQNQSARVCRVLSIPAQLLSPDGVRAGRDDLVCRVGPCHREQSQKGRFCPLLGPLRPATKPDKLSGGGWGGGVAFSGPIPSPFL